MDKRFLIRKKNIIMMLMIINVNKIMICYILCFGKGLVIIY